MSQFFVLPTCAAIVLSFSHYYLINLKCLLLNLRDRPRHKSFYWVIPCQITQKKEKMKPHLFRFCLNLECGIIRDGDEDISIFSLIGQAVSKIWPI